ncbi:MAG: hypothetical protein R2705_11620 [Ilumatobacteraceae bacterium]
MANSRRRSPICLGRGPDHHRSGDHGAVVARTSGRARGDEHRPRPRISALLVDDDAWSIAAADVQAAPTRGASPTWRELIEWLERVG